MTIDLLTAEQTAGGRRLPCIRRIDQNARIVRRGDSVWHSAHTSASKNPSVLYNLVP